MKNIFLFMVLIGLTFLFCSPPLDAQQGVRTRIGGTSGWYYNTVHTFDNEVTTAETSATIHPGGFSLSSLTYSVADTTRDTIYVDLSVDDEASWSVIATKAVNCTDVLVPLFYEEMLRDGDSDILDTVVGSLRIRNNRATLGNGTAGSRPSIVVKFNFKP